MKILKGNEVVEDTKYHHVEMHKEGGVDALVIVCYEDQVVCHEDKVVTN